ncbi:MAG: hypothetical protein HYY04_09035 [Chloroflexi bacterium]|nr:hypothetical protein [Chloroflexota bacterium]
MAQPIREVRGRLEEAREPTISVFEQLSNLPSSTYWLSMVGSMLASLGLFLTGRRWESLFVGLWVPTVLLSGLFYKMLRPEREIRSMLR